MIKASSKLTDRQCGVLEGILDAIPMRSNLTLRLSNYATPEDLTPELLFATTDHHPYGQSTLQLLAETGHLPQIPVECLPPEVVFECRNYPRKALDCIMSFALYCASAGIYHQLPKEYWTRDHILHKSPEFISCDTPLSAAIRHGHLEEFPVSELCLGDIGEDLVYQAASHQQLHHIEDFVRPEDIEVRTLRCCFIECHLPRIILENLAVDIMLDKTNCRDSVLGLAACFGGLEQIPQQAFLKHFHDVKHEVLRSPENIQQTVFYHSEFNLPVESAERLLVLAQKWIHPISQHYLTQASRLNQGRD